MTFTVAADTRRRSDASRIASLPVRILIGAIQRVVEAGTAPIPWSYLSKGDRVQVQFGPLTGIEGFVLRADGKERLILSVDLLQRSVAVEIDRSHIRPLVQKVASPNV